MALVRRLERAARRARRRGRGARRCGRWSRSRRRCRRTRPSTGRLRGRHGGLRARPAGAAFGAGPPVPAGRRLPGGRRSRSWCVVPSGIGLRERRGAARRRWSTRGGWRRCWSRTTRPCSLANRLPATCRSWTRWTPCRGAGRRAGGRRGRRPAAAAARADRPAAGSSRRLGSPSRRARRRGARWPGCSSTPPTPSSRSADRRATPTRRDPAAGSRSAGARVPFARGPRRWCGPARWGRRAAYARAARTAPGTRSTTCGRSTWRRSRPRSGRGPAPAGHRPVALAALRADAPYADPAAALAELARRAGAHGRRPRPRAGLGRRRCRRRAPAATAWSSTSAAGRSTPSPPRRDVVAAGGRGAADRVRRGADRHHGGRRGVGQARAGAPRGGAAGAARRGRPPGRSWTGPRRPRPSARSSSTGPAGLLPFSRRWRRGSGARCACGSRSTLVGGNVARALRTLGVEPATVVVVGGPGR